MISIAVKEVKMQRVKGFGVHWNSANVRYNAATMED
jgi:hypothetical protein